MQDDIKPPQTDDALSEPKTPPPGDSPAETPSADPPPKQEPQPQEPPDNGQAPAPKPDDIHKEHHLVAIILAIVVLVFLAVIAIMAGMKKSADQAPAATDISQQTSIQPAAQDDSGDNQTIDDSIKTIDNLPKDEDASGQDLSDQNLGL